MKKLISLLVLTVLCGSSAFSQTSRTWTGSTDTDWNTASNWSPSGVPATIDHVAIPNTTNKPKLSGNVTIANFEITGGELDLDGDTLTVNGTLRMTGGVVKDGLLKKTSTAALIISGVTVECELDLTAENVTISDSRFLFETKVTRTGATPFGTHMYGNVWEASASIANASTVGGLYIGVSAPDTFLSHLHLTNTGIGLFLGMNGGNDVVLAGTGAQNLTINSSSGISGRNLTIDKPSGHVQLSGLLVITNQLTLTKGVIKCEPGALVKLNNNATISGTSHDSHIEGPVRKGGNQSFFFPVGRNGRYRPIGISDITSSSRSEYTAEYFIGSSSWTYDHASKESSIDDISHKEYWTLTKDPVYATDVDVSLSWDTATSCSFTSMADLLVTAWDGSEWKDLGNGGTTGTADAGTVVTASPSSIFGVYTIASSTTLACEFGPVHFECLGSENDTTGVQKVFDPDCRDFMSYLITDSVAMSKVPVKRVRVNLHVMQKDDSTGNLANTPQIRAMLESIFKPSTHDPPTMTINRVPFMTMGDPVPAHPFGSPDSAYVNLGETRIEFDLQGIYYHQNTAAWNNGTVAWNQHRINPETELNIFLRHRADNPNTLQGSAEHLASNCVQDRRQARVFVHRNWTTQPLESYLWNLRGMIAHEIGHAIGISGGVDLAGWPGSHTSNPNNGCPFPVGHQSHGNDRFSDTYYPDVMCSTCSPGRVHLVDAFDTIPYFHETLLVDTFYLMRVEYDCLDSTHVTSNNVMGYNNGPTYFSPMQIARMHQLLTTDLHNYLDCDSQQTDSITYIPDGDTIEWNHGRIMTGDLVIESGATLTVRCVVSFPPGTKAIVHPGGKLIIDGGKFTSSCGSMWQGIEVWGQLELSQTAQNQGWLELTNDAIIEHAHTAIQVSRPGYWNQSGGVVKAEDSRILNCANGVGFPLYARTNISSFTNCLFRSDQPLNHPMYNGRGTWQFAAIWEAHGITFEDCTFDFMENSTCFPSPLPMDQRPHGIIMIDGGARIRKGTGSGCTFSNLKHGLVNTRTVGSVGIRRYVCTDATFTNCARAVQLEGANLDYFKDNTFNMWSGTVQSQWYPSWGVYAINSRTYTLLNNHFEGIDGPGTPAYGTISRGTMWASGPLLDPTTTWTYSGGDIRANTFKHLALGSQTEQLNPALKLRCNQYDTTQYAWAINPGSYNEPAGYGGYLGPQGTGCVEENPTHYRAGNLFHDAGDHIWSWASPEKHYFAVSGGNDPALVPVLNSTAFFMDMEPCVLGDIDNSCDGGITTFEVAKAKKADLDAAMTVLDDEYADTYDNLDDSNTSALLAHIADDQYNTSTLATELLASGFLSDTVLKAAAQRQPFFHENDFTAIVINNSPVSHPVWRTVVRYGLPEIDQTLQDSIAAAQLTDTLRTLEVLRREIMKARSDHFEVVNSIMGLYVEADSIPALIGYLVDSLATPEYRRLAVGTALSADTVQWARSILESLDLQNTNDSTFYEFHNLALSLAEDTLTWFSLDSTQLVRMWELAESPFDVAIHAQAVLALVLDIVIERTPEPLPSSHSGKMGEEEGTEARSVTAQSVRVFPNPFRNSFNVEYVLETDARELRMEVFDLMGKKVKEVVLRNVQSGTVSIDLGQCLGIYVLRIEADRRRVHQQKVVCVQY